MMAEWEVLGEAFCAFQTPKHSRLHDIDSPYYWVPQYAAGVCSQQSILQCRNFGTSSVPYF